MPTKIRFLGNVGEHNPKQNNVYIGMIQDAIVPAHNGRLIAFVVRGQFTQTADVVGLDLAIQEQKYISDAVNITKTTTFPVDLIPELITFEQFQSLDITSGGQNGNGTRIALTAFTNDITTLKVGYQAVGFGAIRGGGVTIAEMEELLNYDINGDDIIGEINNLKKALETQKPGTTLGFLDGIKDTLNGIHPQAWNAVKWTGIGIGINLGTKMVVGKPLVGKGGLVINTK